MCYFRSSKTVSIIQKKRFEWNVFSHVAKYPLKLYGWSRGKHPRHETQDTWRPEVGPEERQRQEGDTRRMYVDTK